MLNLLRLAEPVYLTDSCLILFILGVGRLLVWMYISVLKKSLYSSCVEARGLAFSVGKLFS